MVNEPALSECHSPEDAKRDNEEHDDYMTSNDSDGPAPWETNLQKMGTKLVLKALKLLESLNATIAGSHLVFVDVNAVIAKLVHSMHITPTPADDVRARLRTAQVAAEINLKRIKSELAKLSLDLDYVDYSLMQQYEKD